MKTIKKKDRSQEEEGCQLPDGCMCMEDFEMPCEQCVNFKEMKTIKEKVSEKSPR